MAKAFSADGGRVRSIMPIRRDNNGQPQPLPTSVPDGDTIGIHVEGSGAVRFLGIDSPEKAFEVPGSGGQVDLGSPQWETYLTDPFHPQFGPFALEEPLLEHLKPRVGSGAGANHRLHAGNAQQALAALVQADMTALGQTPNNFAYFVAFEFEVFDSFGRFLAFINRNQPSSVPSPRPPSYNARMLESGAALPYFIWPNIDPFRTTRSLLDAVVPPGTANTLAEATPALKQARDFVRQARLNGNGVFDQANPLGFEAFEIRYLGRRAPPDRAVIDLSRNDDIILRPQSYFRIPNPEDRLFIPLPFVPLFSARGWRLEGWF